MRNEDGLAGEAVIGWNKTAGWWGGREKIYGWTNIWIGSSGRRSLSGGLVKLKW